MCKVSIIIPVFGVEKYIECCARSLFEQTLGDIEYIFVDDCTKDDSIVILKNILEEYPHRKHQVVIHQMEKNSGQAKVREWGVRNASGIYVIHCDSDDWMEVNMCEALYNRAIKEDADILFFDYFINSNNQESVFYRNNINYRNNDDVFRTTLVRPWLNPLWGVLVKRDLYKKVSYPKGDQSEDNAYVIQLVYYSKRIKKYDGPLYHYRLTPNSISHSKDRDSIIKRYKDIECNRHLIREFAIRYDLLNKFPREFQVYFFKAKFILNSYLSDKTCRCLWKSSFPNYNKGIFRNPYVEKKDKAQFLFCKLKMLFRND